MLEECKTNEKEIGKLQWTEKGEEKDHVKDGRTKLKRINSNYTGNKYE